MANRRTHTPPSRFESAIYEFMNNRGGRELSFGVMILGAVGLGLIGADYKKDAKTNKDVAEAVYDSTLELSAKNIARTAVEHTQRPDSILSISSAEPFKPVVISYNSSERQENGAEVMLEIGQTDGNPDPEKVRSIYLRQPQKASSGIDAKVLKISAPSTPDEIWDATLYASKDGTMVPVAGNLNPSQPPGSDSGENLGIDIGQPEELALQADKMFSQVLKGIHNQG